MHKYKYTIVDEEGYVILDLTSSYTTLTKADYFSYHIAELLPAIGASFGTKAFVMDWEDYFNG